MIAIDRLRQSKIEGRKKANQTARGRSKTNGEDVLQANHEVAEMVIYTKTLFGDQKICK